MAEGVLPKGYFTLKYLSGALAEPLHRRIHHPDASAHRRPGPIDTSGASKASPQPNFLVSRRQFVTLLVRTTINEIFISTNIRMTRCPIKCFQHSRLLFSFSPSH